MSQPALESRLNDSVSGAADRIAGLVLARIAASPAAEAVLARDLLPFVSQRMSSGIWRTELARHLTALEISGQVERHGSEIAATASGLRSAMKFLGLRKEPAGGWPRLRDGALVAKALGVENLPATRLKALSKADGLRMLIVEAAWELKLKGRPSAGRLRSELALIALGRAFGNQIANGLDAKSGLPAKAARLLAGQLAKKPRDFKTDSRLVAALAAEAVGASKSDLAHLRLAAMRCFVSGGFGARENPPATQAPRPGPSRVLGEAPPQSAALRLVGVPIPEAQAPASPRAHAEARPEPKPIVRPDPAGFAKAVKAAALARAEGWSGNRKTFVSHVWSAIADQYPEWGLSEIEFKCMLTEAHRTGLIALANADLKDNRREFVDSAVVYKNTIWHYVRVED